MNSTMEPEELLATFKDAMGQAIDEGSLTQLQVNKMVIAYLSGLYSSTKCSGIRVNPKTKKRIEDLCNRIEEEIDEGAGLFQ